MFNEFLNPGTLIVGAMVVFGIAGLIGKYLTHRDNQRGYCEL